MFIFIFFPMKKILLSFLLFNACSAPYAWSMDPVEENPAAPQHATAHDPSASENADQAAQSMQTNPSVAKSKPQKDTREKWQQLCTSFSGAQSEKPENQRLPVFPPELWEYIIRNFLYDAPKHILALCQAPFKGPHKQTFAPYFQPQAQKRNGFIARFPVVEDNTNTVSHPTHQALGEKLCTEMKRLGIQRLMFETPALSPVFTALSSELLTELNMPLGFYSAKQLAILLEEGQGAYFPHLKTLAISHSDANGNENVTHADFPFGETVFQKLQSSFEALLERRNLDVHIAQSSSSLKKYNYYHLFFSDKKGELSHEQHSLLQEQNKSIIFEDFKAYSCAQAYLIYALRHLGALQELSLEDFVRDEGLGLLFLPDLSLTHLRTTPDIFHKISSSFFLFDHLPQSLIYFDVSPVRFGTLYSYGNVLRHPNLKTVRLKAMDITIDPQRLDEAFTSDNLEVDDLPIRRKAHQDIEMTKKVLETDEASAPQRIQDILARNRRDVKIEDSFFGAAADWKRRVENTPLQASAPHLNTLHTDGQSFEYFLEDLPSNAAFPLTTLMFNYRARPSYCSLTPQAIMNAIADHFPNLQTLHFSWLMNPEDVQALGRLQNLVRLELYPWTSSPWPPQEMCPTFLKPFLDPSFAPQLQELIVPALLLQRSPKDQKDLAHLFAVFRPSLQIFLDHTSGENYQPYLTYLG